MEFDKVFNGLIKYINKEVFSGFNDVQDIVGRIAIKRIIDRKQTIKSTLSGNSFLQAFAVIDDQGNVDIDSLADELKALADGARLLAELAKGGLTGVFILRVKLACGDLHRYAGEGISVLAHANDLALVGEGDDTDRAGVMNHLAGGLRAVWQGYGVHGE